MKTTAYAAGTTMRIVALCLIGLFLSTGCSWLGKTAGKTQAKIERKVDSVERGYGEGYKEEKAKQQHE
ncbi:MAG: hypothetical protein LBC79_03025 [Deltaproteobacteria bacterium]|nr:hypothetical protein [Deltaproteobacteria bacterium]